MTIEEITRKADQIRTLKWIEKIREEYARQESYIRKNPGAELGGYSIRINGGYEHREFNSHLPLVAKYLLAGFRLALKKLDEEIAELKADIESE